MGTINPLQQHTHTQPIHSQATPQHTVKLLRFHFNVSDDHNLSQLFRRAGLCDPVNKLNEGSPPLLFLYDSHPL